MPSRIILGRVVITLLILAGCNRTPERGPITAEDLQIARQALPLTEISLMMRGGYKQEAIVADVMRRHVPAKPDAQTEDALLRAGASSMLISALKDKKNILTENQKEAYDNLNAEKAANSNRAAFARQNEARAEQIAEINDRQRKQYLAQQTLQNARNAEYKEASYQQADRAYKAQKESLEARIISQENYINRARSNGSSEANLRNANAELDRLKEGLRNLTPPLR